MNEILKLHEKVLALLLVKRQENPNLKFWLRQRNTRNKLDEGYWFQGNDTYLAVGFTNKSSGNMSTQSISFIIYLEERNKAHAKIEILYKNNPENTLVECYQEIINTIGGFENIAENNYQLFYKSSNILATLEEFIDKQLPVINKIISKRKLEEDLLIPADKFERSLERVLEIRN